MAPAAKVDVSQKCTWRSRFNNNNNNNNNTAPLGGSRGSSLLHFCFYPPGAPLRRGGVFAQGREAKGGAPLHSVDPCSFLTRVPGGAGYKMLAAPRKGLVRLA